MPDQWAVPDVFSQHPAATSAVGAALLAAVGFWSWKRSESAWTGNVGDRSSSPHKGNPGDPVVLHGFFAPIGELAASVSPFTAKIEAYLRFNDIKYEKCNTTFPNTPKGRLPWLQHGDDKVADSRFIIKYLENTYGSKLKVKQLADPAEVGKGVAITRLCEEHAYFVAQVFRMYTPEGKDWMVRELFGGRRGLGFTLSSLRAGRAKQLRYQGIICNSTEEITALAKEDVDALAGMLGYVSPFFFGEEPTAVDAAVFGMLENYLYDGNFESPLPSMVARHNNLVRFVDNIRETYFEQELAEKEQS